MNQEDYDTYDSRHSYLERLIEKLRGEIHNLNQNIESLKSSVYATQIAIGRAGENLENHEARVKWCETNLHAHLGHGKCLCRILSHNKALQKQREDIIEELETKADQLRKSNDLYRMPADTIPDDLIKSLKEGKR